MLCFTVYMLRGESTSMRSSEKERTNENAVETQQHLANITATVSPLSQRRSGLSEHSKSR